ncbi:hypothetical protein EZS27_025657 [termite gut metagenome]|uniref:Secretion system C-terminal sorting domain-containing protein n=1 Tax=termite gut metagenome TaxID=433724 RepID=A0A5J4QV86_9ZZZZ
MTTEPKSEEVFIRILDTKGQMVYEKNFKAGTWMESQKLDISQFGDGLFLIEITDNDSKSTGMFIKVK